MALTFEDWVINLLITLTCWVIGMKSFNDITLLVSKKTKYDDCQMNEKEKNLPRLLTYYIKGNWGLLHMVSEPG